MNQDILIKPEKLNKGDTIGIISPAGVVKNKDLFEKTVSFFEKKGYKVKIAPHSCDEKEYLAGNDENRLSDLMEYFKNSEIKAIICSRGGYGTMRLLNKIDYGIIRQNPKIFVGYSDITAIHSAILKNSGMVSFHGPLALSDFGADEVDEYTINNFFEVLENPFSFYSYSNPLNYECINPGRVEGRLAGGNLAVLTAILGTPYFPEVQNKILMLEDIAEPLYKIDRMLTQLKLSDVFEKVVGVLFGEFTEISEEEKIKIPDLIREILGEYKIPVGIGFPAGHGRIKATLPLGVKYYFNSEKFELNVMDGYVI